MGIRKSDKRGYDVIRNIFFVEEIVFLDKLAEKYKKINNYFSDFVSYYEFLDGDIYENACYYQYSFSQTEIDNYGIDLNKINTTSLIDFTIKDFSVEWTEEELQQYNKIEKDKVFRKKWIAKKTNHKHQKSNRLTAKK